MTALQRRTSSSPDATRATYTFFNVPAGAQTLVIRLHSERDPLRRIPGLTVRAGEICEDPRLQEVDLRNALRTSTLQIVGGKRRKPISVRAAILVGSNSGWVLLDAASTGTTLLHTARPLEFCVALRGYPLQFGRAAGGKVVVELPQVTRRELRFRHRVRALPEGIQPWVELRPVGPGEGTTVPAPGDLEPGQIVDPELLSLPRSIQAPMRSKGSANGKSGGIVESEVTWPSDRPYELRFFLGRGSRLSPCVARTEKRDGAVFIIVEDDERQRALERL